MSLEEIEKALIEATKLSQQQGGIPKDVWHPDFGWILKDGKPTENTKNFLEMLEKESK